MTTFALLTKRYMNMDLQVAKLREMFLDLLKTSNDMFGEIVKHGDKISLEGLKLKHSYEIDGEIKTATLTYIANNKGSIDVYDSFNNVHVNLSDITIPQRIDILAALKRRQFKWSAYLVHHVSKSQEQIDDATRTFYEEDDSYEDMKVNCMNMVSSSDRVPIKILFKDDRTIECVYEEDSIIYKIRYVVG